MRTDRPPGFGCALRGIGQGLGKLLLCGEHAVVYGHPAIAFAVDRATRVTLERTEHATTLIGAVEDDRLRDAVRAAVPPEGWRVHIASDLPIGRGMGSSAALAVALVRARAHLDGESLGPDQVFDRAIPVERVFHGNPSGVDVAISARGGFLRYRREDGAPRIEPIRRRPRWRVVALDSGEVGNTAVLVDYVAARRSKLDPILAQIGALVDRAFEVLDAPDSLGPLLTENHALLRALGVSNPRLDELVAMAIDSGAWGAKLAGAGGGGVVIALVDDPEPLLRVASQRGISAFACAPAEETP